MEAIASRIARSIFGSGQAETQALSGEGYLNERMLRLITAARMIVLMLGAVALALAVNAGASLSGWALAGIASTVVVVAWSAILHLGRQSHPSQAQLLFEIAFDIVLLTVVLSIIGRDTAFDYLYLLPIVFGTCVFSGWRVILVVAMVTLGWVTIHVFDAQPQGGYASAVVTHVAIGGLIAYFVFAVARLARKHERILSGHRERAITALGAEAKGMVATQAAHALSTPLGTMAVIVADMREGRIPAEEHDAALDTLARQIATCKLQLSGLLKSAGVDRGEGAYRADVFEILNEIREECLLHYPNGSVELLRPDCTGAPEETLMELSLFNALAGIVKDFVREPPHVAELKTAWDVCGAVIEIRRGGPRDVPRPITPRRQERLAVLAAILERHGGALTTGPGERIVVRLPYADNPDLLQ